MRCSSLALIAFALLLAGCGRSPAPAPVAVAPPATSPAVAVTPDLRNVDAKALREVIASHRGQRAVLVNLWATWCEPCVEEFPYLVKLQQAYGDDLVVLFVSADFTSERESVVAFLAKHGVAWPSYFKDDNSQDFFGAISPEWTGALPATAIYDRDGNLRTFFMEPADYATFDQHVREALGRGPVATSKP